jgi:hypothetical protein
MGRIFFLSAMALLAYRYIAKSNQRHQALDPAKDGVEVLPPAAPPVPSQTPTQPQLVGAASRAVEPEPRR